MKLVESFCLFVCVVGLLVWFWLYQSFLLSDGTKGFNIRKTHQLHEILRPKIPEKIPVAERSSETNLYPMSRNMTSTLKMRSTTNLFRDVDIKKAPFGMQNHKPSQETIQTLENHTFKLLTVPTSHSPLTKVDFLIANANFCSKSPLDILIYSHSGVENFELRTTVRDTWGSKDLLKRENASSVFILGRSQNESMQQQVKIEAEQYGDIIQADFIDDYYNLTYKAFMAFQWLQAYCKHVPIIVKTDDDIFWDVESVLPIIRKRLKPRTVICRIYYRNYVIRDPNNKWSVKEGEFKGVQFYPKYCEGLVSAFDSSIIEEMSILMRHTSYFFIEDVWVGYNMAQLLKFNYNNIEEYVADAWSTLADNYKRNGSDIKILITHVIHSNKPNVITNLWNSLQSTKQKAITIQ